MVTLCTFNANNLFVRYRFEETYPGAPPTEGTRSTRFGFLPKYKPQSFQVFNDNQRKLAAKALCRGDGPLPDLVCLQEIESLIALRTFNERYLGGHYTQALLIDSRDYRQIDVGVLATDAIEIVNVRSHVDLLAPKDEVYKPDWPWQFSRDCLEVETRLGPRRSFTFFVNHLKSKFVGRPDRKMSPAERKRWEREESELASDYRLHQGEAVVDLVRARFPGRAFEREWFAVVGDLNSHNREAPARALSDAGLHDVIARLPAEERWTEFHAGGGSVGQLDYLFLSPALADLTDGQLPVIERRGIGMRDVSKRDGDPLPQTVKVLTADDAPPAATIDFRFPRFAAVNAKDRASDHCPVFFELP
jgi:hypothetical protein